MAVPEPWENLPLGDALKPNFRTLQIFGLHPPETGSKEKILLYKIYGVIFTIFIYIMFMLSEVINIILSRNDLEAITEASFLFLTHLSQVVKFYNFIVKHGRISELINSLQRPTFKPRNLRQYKILRRFMWQGQLGFYVFATMGMTTTALWACFPFFDSTTEGLQLPLGGYFPFSTDYSPVFEMCYIYQIAGTAIDALNDIAMDTTVTTMMALMCGELDVLNDTLTNIREYAQENLRKRGIEVEFVENSEEDIPAVLQDEMDKILVECVNQHLDILTTTREITALFTVTVLAQFAVGCIIMCVTMFEMTLIELISVKCLSMVSYQICILIELILYCWFGNEVILKSSDICSAIYHSDWNRCTINYKKKILMIMTRSQEPIRVYAGDLFTLSLTTFAAILRSSWSYFAVLRQVHSED